MRYHPRHPYGQQAKVEARAALALQMQQQALEKEAARNVALRAAEKRLEGCAEDGGKKALNVPGSTRQS